MPRRGGLRVPVLGDKFATILLNEQTKTLEKLERHGIAAWEVHLEIREGESRSLQPREAQPRPGSRAVQ